MTQDGDEVNFCCQDVPLSVSVRRIQLGDFYLDLSGDVDLLGNRHVDVGFE